MSIGATRIKRIWNRIVTRLERDLPGWRKRIESFGQLAAVQRRRAGGKWSDSQVFEALLLAILSNSTDWSKIERIKPELCARFHDFDPRWYARRKATEVDTIVAWFENRRAGSMSRAADLGRLVDAAASLNQRSHEFGSMENFLQDLRDHHDPELMAAAIGGSGSAHKLPGLGIALAAEFLKNVGFELGKPDRHVNRALGSFGLMSFNNWKKLDGPPNASEDEMIEVMRALKSLAGSTGESTVFVDNAIWLLCATSGLHLTNAELTELAYQSARSGRRPVIDGRQTTLRPSQQ